MLFKNSTVIVAAATSAARGGEKLSEIEVFAVHALEMDASKGVRMLEWLLVSSVTTPAHAEAIERIGGYVRCGTIGSRYRMLMNGCCFEAWKFDKLDLCGPLLYLR
ncbi:hypothetical protein [Paraburkholderia caballeronis]|uniref:Uncharacterized protein n=1 Tax=Paraburkholderia caballeronis TaxID=416943 RepID=A0A1H7L7A1_9BURK|nr:hypothetical protein [Paraburkholderia caballeronis]PXW28328.1 hypothetical protein C7403_102220 [Paraburkholderia caballeronis]PXX03694.1 hypothetical protein C7407_102220 [Paraburkholderia caballeronis]RAK04438.1 hypothetical protein C7409_102220 [Paraburkholderia caballeronis]SEK94923.1 hypothetical protein SAMN05192542_104220 [Paraburkholderia caballeronis]